MQACISTARPARRRDLRAALVRRRLATDWGQARPVRQASLHPKAPRRAVRSPIRCPLGAQPLPWDVAARTSRARRSRRSASAVSLDSRMATRMAAARAQPPTGDVTAATSAFPPYPPAIPTLAECAQGLWYAGAACSACDLAACSSAAVCADWIGERRGAGGEGGAPSRMWTNSSCVAAGAPMSPLYGGNMYVCCSLQPPTSQCASDSWSAMLSTWLEGVTDLGIARLADDVSLCNA